MRQHLPLLAATALAIPGLAFAQDDGAAQRDRIGMAVALEAAQAQVQGGVLEAELDSEDGKAVYEIEMVQGEDIYELHVDAQTGEVVSQSEETITGIVSGLFQEDELQAAEKSRGTLGPAIADLESQPDTWVEEVEFDDEDDRWVYEIQINDASGEREITIDAMTGEIVTDGG